MSKTEKRLSYKAGITRTPSDFLCQDGELAECINLVTDHEELKVVVEPAAMFGGAAKSPIVYVHEGSTYKNYITRDGAALAWFDEDGHGGDVGTVASASGGVQVTHVGNFLIVADGSGMRYYLWKAGEGAAGKTSGRSEEAAGKTSGGGEEAAGKTSGGGEDGGPHYSDMGDRIPEPEVEFAMVYGNWGGGSRSARLTSCSGALGDCLRFESIGGGSSLVAPHVKDGKQEAYNDLVVGLYAKSLKSVAEDRRFSRPFAVRYALELYDGSYTYLSAPVMLFPSITKNCWACNRDGNLTVGVVSHLLAFKGTFDYGEWSDLVKGVVVFCSPEVPLYETGGDQSPRPGYNLDGTGVEYRDGIVSGSSRQSFAEHESHYVSSAFSATTSVTYFLPLNQRSRDDILDDLRSVGNFYKLFEAGLRGSGSWESSLGCIKSHVLETLTTQEQLKGGDYYSRCALVPGFMMSYNSRLLLAGVRRGFFEGFTSFLPYDNEGAHDIDIYVFIKTADGTRVVKKSYWSSEKVGLYFYYPDPRAYRAVAFLSGAWLCTMDLKEHPYLNGAYYFEELPGDVGEQSSTFGGEYAQVDLDAALDATPEHLESQLFTSEVGNPFVFAARGNKTIGTGKIVALATLTTALSQGQFGQHPVIAFSSDGIWALQVDGGGYLEPAQPMSREVCVNANSVLETDGAVYFASKKGLMVVVGNQVRCVSGLLNGVAVSSQCADIGDKTEWEGLVRACSVGDSFLGYIRSAECFMAYDYIDSRILVINPSYGYVYAYGMGDGTLSKVVLGASVVRAVRSYPDYLLQSSDGVVWSLYGKEDECEVTARSLAFLLTRPMKMGGPTGVVSLRELVNVGRWSRKGGSVVKTRVWVSDDLETWCEAGSRFGAAAKYFRIGLYVKMLPSERLSGTVLQVQSRRDDNAR